MNLLSHAFFGEGKGYALSSPSPTPHFWANYLQSGFGFLNSSVSIINKAMFKFLKLQKNLAFKSQLTFLARLAS